ncbi:MAG TPA: Rad52/Rad22 family DNA repair protein [Acidobacteriota bacterium]|jgi:hypothetical protein
MQKLIITQTAGGFRVGHTEDPQVFFMVTKPNGRLVCNCPDYNKNAPKGECDHISEVVRLLNGQVRSKPNGWAGQPNVPVARKGPAKVDSLPALEKSQLAVLLEYPFRDDQVKAREKDGAPYIDGASVIQRLNDVLGPENWSFRLMGDPQQLEDEAVVRGRLIVRINGRSVVKEDFGAHEYARKRADKAIVSRGDTIKAAVTDCIKRCAHQLGVGLHLYSKDGQYRSFRVGGPEVAKPAAIPPSRQDAVASVSGNGAERKEAS